MKIAMPVWISTTLLLLSSLVLCSGCAGNNASGKATTITTTSTVTGTPSPFVMYDNTYYPNSAAVLETAGTLRAAVLYSQSAWPGTCSSTGCPNAPTQAQFQASLQAYVKEFGTSNTIIFDYENLVISEETSTAAANNAVALFLQMIAWTRAIYPNAKIGMYDYEWSSNYVPNSSSGFNSIRAQLFKGGAASFDFFAPTMYQRWTTHTIWDQNLAQSIINDSAVNLANGVSLPIYPYISPYVSGNLADALLAGSEWQAELADLVSCNKPSSSACSMVMSTLTPTAGNCSAAGSTTACTAIGGGILYVGTSTTNLDPTSSWVGDITAILSPAVSTSVMYRIADSAQTALCVDANVGTVPSANTCGTQASQDWIFTSLGTGFYSVKSFSYQQANSSRTSSEIWDGTSGTVQLTQVASAGATTAGQEWQVVSLGNGYYEFVKLADYATNGNTDSEECLTAGATGQVITTSVCNFGTNQMFQLTPE